MVGGVQGCRNGHGRGPSHAVGVALLPGKPRDRVVDGEAVSAPGEAGLGARELRVLAELGQSADHPVHPAMPETRYLKGVLCHLS